MTIARDIRNESGEFCRTNSKQRPNSRRKSFCYFSCGFGRSPPEISSSSGGEERRGQLGGGKRRWRCGAATPLQSRTGRVREIAEIIELETIQKAGDSGRGAFSPESKSEQKHPLLGKFVIFP